MDDGSDKYVYQDLDRSSGAFRLMRLKAGTGLILECDLLHTNIEDADNQYESISYTWGDNEGVDMLHINGKRLGITYNLCMILHDLRWADIDRMLWVDAVCINQQNDVERGHQVQQMKVIYESAERVIFCVGRPTESTDFLLDCLGELQKRCQENGVTIRDDESLVSAWDGLQRELENEHYVAKRRQREGLEHLLAQPWFTRVWILQEVANARHGIVHCGTRSVTAAIFSRSLGLIDIVRQPENQQHRAVQKLMANLGGERKTGDPDRSLFHLITAFSGAQATDAHDKVYGLLGMCMDGASDATLVPDYTISRQAVMKNALAHMCRRRLQISTMLPCRTIQEFLDDLARLGEVKLLSWAARRGHTSIVQLLLEKGANPDSMGNKENTLLMELAGEDGIDRVEIMRLLLRHGADTDARGFRGVSALMMAAGSGNRGTVKLLLEFGARTEAKDKQDHTASWHAAYYRRFDIAALLRRSARRGTPWHGRLWGRGHGPYPG